ncbi:NAD-dependent epimerase/dehydratase family protein [Paenibacillus favisporus]|uniref:NAD-dependent epimerase/dehydratase family protein n=1 Tax=Paenibacillus favisporus TaxID=221028 RepID=UPI0013D0C273|nr:NAD(P)-dependent oxidoreductase [Paenibacillus favisporus]
MIMITGGMGFIGLHAARALLDLGEDVIITRYREDRLPSFLVPYLNKRLFIETVDVLQAESLLGAGKKHAVTGLMHLASPRMNVPPVEGTQQTVQSLLHVLECGSRLEVRRVVFASSIAVYAGVEMPLWREDDALPVQAPYPMTAYKKVAETIGDFYSRQAGLEVVSARFSAFGPLARGLYFLPAQAVHAAVNGLPLSSYLRGGLLPYEEEGMDVAYVTDTAEALARLQTAPSLAHSVYNIGTGQVTTHKQMVEAILRVVPDARLELRPGKGDGPQYPAMDISRIYKELGWQPRYSLDLAIAEYAAWLRDGNPF